MDDAMFTKGDYGIDAPAIVRNLTLMGVGFLILSIVVFSVFPRSLHWMGQVLLISCVIGFLEMLYMIWSSKVGKFRERERVLDLVSLCGDEKVLDVGCGRGLILNGAARRLTTGKAIGIDIWNKQDQSGNHPDVTWENARIEGVIDRVEVLDGDARNIPFADNYFDAVVSSLAIHNIYNREERRQALFEMIGVLKPGGRIAILDFRHVKEYAQVFQEAGVLDVKIIGPHYLMFPPVRIVTGRKPYSEATG